MKNPIILSDVDGPINKTYQIIQRHIHSPKFLKEVGLREINMDLDYGLPLTAPHDFWLWAEEWWYAIVKHNIELEFQDNVENALKLLSKKYDIHFYTMRPTVAFDYTRKTLRSILPESQIKFVYNQGHMNDMKLFDNKIEHILELEPDIVIEDDPKVIQDILALNTKFPNKKQINVIQVFTYPWDMVMPFPNPHNYLARKNWTEIQECILY